MHLTLDKIQPILIEAYDLVQFIFAILGVISIPLLFFKNRSFDEDDATLPPDSFTLFLEKTCSQLGIPRLMMYIRPQAYYDNLSKQLNDSELAKSSKGAVICLASAVEASDESAHVSGLVNTGNSCFLNSVLQAMSSLPHLHTYLEHVSNISTGVPLPVTRSLLKTLRAITKPLYRRSSFRPVDIVAALSSNRRIISREQQDAQEFFQLVSSAMETEGQQIAKTESLGGGLKDLLGTSSGMASGMMQIKKKPTTTNVENPLTGLLANRLSCMQCGYTSAIRHFSFNNIQLNVPNKYTATLAECLAKFTDIEYLEDANCRRCSFETTVKSLTTQISECKKEMKKKKNKLEAIIQIKKIEDAKREIETRLKTGRIEEEEEDKGDRLRLLNSVSRSSTKQVMLAKPPKVLCLHISRSAFLNTGAIYKNTCQLLFPEYLDVSPFSTNGTLHTQPDLPISTPTQKSDCFYRLMSVVVHYGSHSFGHFVAFKRRIYADQCKCFSCTGGKASGLEEWKCQNAWYRISDSKVDECSLDDVLRSNPYMLLYELIDEDEYTQEMTSVEESEEEEEWDDMSVLSSTDYNNMPMDNATKEALRIANSLLIVDHC
ncbi:uncharacterized protein EV154DRAFT_530678 [Mucor mucedo]|uniref:uncharacterized protein n=1 Tax=Mucor mucedo TaxID=29922 RepID=UPI00221E8C3B|nr:uncharacterized protein EV154DRAFT_530678 [Mucor mucedo]KAI7869590.1 hypothetical protein EV154DRAFT_530678 [Mucor mucedo]